MPYRRLPNTDKARLRALKNAVKQADIVGFSNNIVIQPKNLIEAENFASIFESKMNAYKQVLQNQINANKQYQQVLYNARMYISHFIQVLNLSVIRGDIKSDQKLYYHLSTENHNVPDLFSEASIAKWGKNIIEGEKERTRNGGFPIYNPTIGKVQVHFEIFKEFKMNQKLYQHTTNKNLKELAGMRVQADEIILDIWNQVEEYYKDETHYNKLEKCKKFGLVFYYRKNEKPLQPDSE